MDAMLLENENLQLAKGHEKLRKLSAEAGVIKNRLNNKRISESRRRRLEKQLGSIEIAMSRIVREVY